MKKIIFIIIMFFPIVFQYGCKHATEPAEVVYVSYEIGNDFQDDFVILTLDGGILLESIVTTNYTLSLAWSSGLQKLSRKNHILNFFVVEYGVQKDFQIDTANDTSTVLISFHKNTNQIDIRQIKGRTIRD
ncbi:MAG TPA: hypothetical protein VLM39_13025 [Ignavibacteriaceae bacterium]|nr:hypothetical protein [Ignavibacteriaceae bacterium]